MRRKKVNFVQLRTEVTMPASSSTSPNAAAPQNPTPAYAARLDACRREAATLQRRNLWLGYLRLLWVIVAAALAWSIFARHRLPPPVLLLPFLAFAVTARLHARVLAAAARSQRAVSWYEHGLARVEGRWAGLQPRTVPPTAGESLYAADLDLFGPGSLFELLCTARTSLGEDTLAAWLLHPANAEEVLARQAAVAELRDRLTLREAMASADGPASFRLNPAALAAWGEAQTSAVPGLFRWLAPLLALLTLAAAVRWAMGHGPVLFSAALLVNGSITFALQGRFNSIFEKAEQGARPLRLLAGLFALLEAEPFSSDRLRSSQALLLAGGTPANGMETTGTPASQAMLGMARLAGAVEQRSNFVARLLDFGLLYSVHLALLLQRWRGVHGGRLRGWLGSFGEIEAMIALSAYHFEHPEDRFPQLTSEAAFHARGLGHPLLPDDRCVRNDLSLDSERRLIVVSGSNMSGKSTLLRSTGIACVMAMAGAPVRAHALRLGPLGIGASIQVQDSLQGGRSRFYAEILRLRAVCELARQHPPALFLLDELLAGTNSQDRLEGATGILETLLRSGAIGLLSTHDLALTKLGAETQAIVHNAHFEDRIEGDGLHFDYTLRDGVITRNNGLDLMRLIGLEV